MQPSSYKIFKWYENLYTYTFKIDLTPLYPSVYIILRAIYGSYRYLIKAITDDNDIIDEIIRYILIVKAINRLVQVLLTTFKQ